MADRKRGRVGWGSAGIGMLALALLLGGPARAETGEVSIAIQYGLGYAPVMVMEKLALVEKRAEAAGLGPVKTRYVQLGGPAAVNDSLISGAVQFGSVGTPSLITLWSRTRDSLGVRTVGAISMLPMYLVTTNPNIRTLADFTEQDKIAVPSVKVSIQAVTLQMAVVRAFGRDSYARLDPLTVSMSHPDAATATLAGSREVTAHFSSPPFQYQQLDSPRIHKVLNSYDVLGGPASFVFLVTTAGFVDKNPRLALAVSQALQDGMDWINADKPRAAEFYLKTSGSKEKPADVLRQLDDPEIRFTRTPYKTMAYADFMASVGSIKARPAAWSDMVFPMIADLNGD